jgi:D-3-phosphoglycerate dehydrogenase / 2-oxoglutarate reductase
MNSFPKHKIKVLLLENVHDVAESIFSDEGFQLIILKEALNEIELIEQIKDVHILGIRSKTQVTEKVISQAEKLLCIGTFCIGTNQIDLIAAAKKGIVVFNAPYSNTRSVVELAVGEMIMLMRNVFTKSQMLHDGKWDKSAKHSVEIRGKKLGLIGYGNIGSQFSVIAEALGMHVFFYDISDKLALGNATKCKTLHELLAIADVVSVHVDGRVQNTHLIGTNEISNMKDHAIFMNLSRGHVVDIDALKSAIDSGKVWGASIDVFPYEPKSNDEIFTSPLRNSHNTILTPHIGGSTEEAQANIGEFVSHKILQYINKGDSYGAVNFPEVQLPSFEHSHRLLHIHENVPGILAQINSIYAKHQINIQAQFLKTIDAVGYVITDIATGYDLHVLDALKTIPHTIKFRILY